MKKTLPKVCEYKKRLYLCTALQNKAKQNLIFFIRRYESEDKNKAKKLRS